MTDSQLIKSFVDEYQLEVNGVKFWTPYFINTPKAKGNLEGPNIVGPYLGKGSPEQIRASLQEMLEKEGVEFSGPEDYRKFMFDRHLGIECSGFAYWVMDAFLKAKDKGNLIEHLHWDKELLLKAYREKLIWHQSTLNIETIEKYPDKVRMSRVVADWGWDHPAKMVNILRLVDESSVECFNDVTQLAPGDFIYEVGVEDGIDHVLIVSGVGDNQINFTHSTGTHGREGFYGGVQFGSIKITDPAKPIEEQEWDDDFVLKTHVFGNNALRRLKVLADA